MATSSSTPATSDDPMQVVETFLHALAAEDLDVAFDLLADDTVWHNVPFPPARGKRTVTRQLSALAGQSWWFTVELHNIAANGGTVLTERTDGLGYGAVGGEFWVCGTFEVRDGRITLWRDRFDFADIVAGTVRGTARTLWQRVSASRTR